MKSSRTIFAALGIPLLLILVGCDRAKPAKATAATVVFGVSPFPDTYMPVLGKIKGWYAEEGLDVQFRILGWTEVQEALSSSAAKKVDVGINNFSAIVATHHKNPELVYYYGFNTFDNGFALMSRAQGGLQPLSFFLDQGLERSEAIKQCGAQLKNKTVVTTANTDMEQGVAAFARRGGLDFLKDVKVVDLNPDEGLAAFLSGTGDAYIGGIPHGIKAGEQGMVKIITGTDLGPAPINGLVTTQQYAATNRTTLNKLLKVWFRIVQYTDAHLDEVAGLMVGELNKNTAAGVTPETFKLLWNNLEHYPATPEAIDEQILAASGKNYWQAGWKDCNSYFFDVKKAIPKPLAPEEAFLMIEAQRSLKEYLTESK